MEKKEPYGLVLSGGGAKGMAHIGAIKALEEYGIEPSIVTGTSIGAIIGTFYAAGYSPEEILDFFSTTSLFKVSNLAFGKAGFIDTDKFYKVFKHHFHQDNFNVLQRELFITATDIIEGKNRFFTEGSLIKALLASAAVPGIFTPVEFEGHLYADGGILNHFPVEPLLERCEKIIGVYVSPLKAVEAKDLNSSYAIVERAYQLATSMDSFHKFDTCDYLICPDDLTAYGTFDVNNLQKIYELGYEEAKKVLSKD